MGFQRRAVYRRVDLIGVFDKDHGVRIAHIDGHKVGEIGAIHRHVIGITLLRQRNLLPVEAGGAHIDADPIIFRAGADQGSGDGFKVDALDAELFQQQMGDAACAVAAGLRLRSVGVVDAHESIAAVFGRLNRQELVIADTAPTIAHGAVIRLGKLEWGIAGIDDDKIIAEAMHFHERNAFHGRKHSYAEGSIKVLNPHFPYSRRPTVPVVDHLKLTELTTSMIQAMGSTEGEARAVAENLVAANLMGHDSHGVGLAPRYMMHHRTGTLTPGAEPKIVSDNGTYLLVDGDLGYGQVIGPAAMDLAIERARANGVCIMGLRNVHHLGRIGAWAERAADAGYISINYVNGTGHRPYVAPHGGYDGRYSTNPYCTAIPATGETPRIVLDFATSQVAQGKVRVAYNSNKQSPEGSLVGPDGLKTTDPSVIFEEPYGAMLAFAEHKGFGLAMICEILAGGMTGGGTTRPELAEMVTIRNNMLTILIDPNGFDAEVPFADEIKSLVEYVSSSRTTPGIDRIRFPGDPERETMAKRKVEGIVIDDTTWAEMIAAGLEAGMDQATFDAMAG